MAEATLILNNEILFLLSHLVVAAGLVLAKYFAPEPYRVRYRRQDRFLVQRNDCRGEKNFPLSSTTAAPYGSGELISAFSVVCIIFNLTSAVP